MESEKYICVRETSPQNSVVIIDMSMPMQPLRRPITADSALMHPDTRILALKGKNSLSNLAGVASVALHKCNMAFEFFVFLRCEFLIYLSPNIVACYRRHRHVYNRHFYHEFKILSINVFPATVMSLWCALIFFFSSY